MSIVWYCDSCDAELNRQSGFSTALGSWTCSKCGCLNDVTDENILSDDEIECVMSLQAECPVCGGHMRRGQGYARDVFVCEECGQEAEDDGFGNLIYDE